MCPRGTAQNLFECWKHERVNLNKNNPLDTSSGIYDTTVIFHGFRICIATRGGVVAIISGAVKLLAASSRCERKCEQSSVFHSPQMDQDQKGGE